MRTEKKQNRKNNKEKLIKLYRTKENKGIAKDEKNDNGRRKK